MPANMEHEEALCELRCERCGEWLKRERIVWLELSNTDGLYRKPGALPEGHVSQGGFPFGSACARRVLKEQENGR
jgi:hypothetical protein